MPKKRIRDLTQEEIDSICAVDKYGKCINVKCPLYLIEFIIDCKKAEREIKRYSEILDKEVEVENE